MESNFSSGIFFFSFWKLFTVALVQLKGYSLAEPDPLPDRYAWKGSGQLTIPISFAHS